MAELSLMCQQKMIKDLNQIATYLGFRIYKQHVAFTSYFNRTGAVSSLSWKSARLLWPPISKSPTRSSFNAFDIDQLFRATFCQGVLNAQNLTYASHMREQQHWSVTENCALLSTQQWLPKSIRPNHAAVRIQHRPVHTKHFAHKQGIPRKSST